jgi:hypothetical protein
MGAVIEISSIKHFVGGSTETKPTTCPAGSRFIEVTVGTPPEAREYVFDGTAWALVVRTSEDLPA